MDLLIIHTEHAVLLSKQSHLSWRELQAVIPDYKASLGPWSAEDVVAYLASDYGHLEPEAPVLVESFVQSPAVVRELAFRASRESAPPIAGAGPSPVLDHATGPHGTGRRDGRRFVGESGSAGVSPMTADRPKAVAPRQSTCTRLRPPRLAA